MNHPRTIKRNTWVSDIRSEMSHSRRVVAQSVIGFDQSNNCCKEVARELGGIASTIDPRLAAAISPIALDSKDISIRELEKDGGDAWQVLAESALVFVPKGPAPIHQPGLTLVLPVELFMSQDLRSRLLQQITELHDKYSSVVCLFIDDETSERNRGTWNESWWRSRLAEMSQVAPKAVVRFYLVGATTNDGRLVTLKDLTSVAAHATIADVVLRDRRGPRLLAQSVDKPEASIGVLGMSGQLFSADAVAQKLAPRLCSDLVRELEIAPAAGTQLPDDLPISLGKFLVRAFQHQMPFHAQSALERGESSESFDYDVPSLVGYDFRFMINLAKAAKTVSLERVPSRLWKRRLTELDAVVSTERADAIAARACEYLETTRQEEERRIQRVLAHSFSQRLNGLPICEIRDQLLDRIEKHNDATLVSGVSEPIDETLSHLEARVEQMGCWRSGVLATLLSLLLGVAAIWACNVSASGSVRFWGSVVPGLVVVGVALGASARWWWSRHLARMARDEVLEQIQRRAQRTICQRLLEALRQTSVQLIEGTRSVARILCDAAGVIEKSFQEQPIVADAHEPLVERPEPRTDDLERVYRYVVREGRSSNSLVDKFRERCTDLAEELIDGSIATGSAAVALREFAENEILLRLSNQMDIWRLYSKDGTAKCFDEVAFLRRVREWSAPVLCSTGTIVDRGNDPASVSTFWICPDAVASRLDRHGEGSLLSMNDRVVALHRLTYRAEQRADVPIPCDPTHV